MADVFISDAREDHAAAARVADLLEARGGAEPRDDTAISEVSIRGWTS